MKTPGKKKEKSPFHLLSSQRELRKQAHSCRTALLLPGAGGDSMSFSRALHLGRFLSSWGHSPVTVWFPNKENCQDRKWKHQWHPRLFLARVLSLCQQLDIGSSLQTAAAVDAWPWPKLVWSWKSHHPFKKLSQWQRKAAFMASIVMEETPPPKKTPSVPDQ